MLKISIPVIVALIAVFRDSQGLCSNYSCPQGWNKIGIKKYSQTRFN